VDPAGIYIHIPFCVRKCPYCDFYSVSDLATIPVFVDALIAEMTLRRQPEKVFDSIYIGGGTPTVLDQEQVCRILEAAGREFAIDPGAEITIEANPGTVSNARLRAFRSAGINRINIGVQSFDDANLEFLGRIHTAEDAKNALHMAEDAGFDNIGLDLIYALPDQTRRNWQKDLETAVDCAPAHISAYMLTCEPGTPLDSDRIAGRFKPAHDSRQAEFFMHARDFLRRHGYEHYEISNFARSARYRSRHNSKYWNNIPYVGFGPAAHSYAPPVRSMNVRSVAEYVEKIREGRLPVGETEKLNWQQLMIEAIYLGLRQAVGIDCAAFANRFGVDFKQMFSDLIGRFTAKGYLMEHDGRIVLTGRGMLMQESIAEAFIETL